MISNVININPLAWYTKEKYQYHNKEWVKKSIAFCYGLGLLPPFQLSIEGFDGLTAFKVINFNTGVEVNLSLEIAGVGFQVEDLPDRGYIQVSYPSIIPFTTVFTTGQYYCEMSDNTNTWFSDVFTMSDGTSEMVKLEWWHNRDFEYHGGHLQYDFPFKMYVYFNTNVARPTWPKTEIITTRDDRQFKTKQITWKEYMITALCPEYLVDALHRVGQHDNVVVTSNENVFETETFDINVKQLDIPDVFDVEMKFTINTGVVVNGKGYQSVEYSADACSCLPNNYVIGKAIITDGGAEYIGKYYFDGVENVPFVDGDWILIDDGVNKRLFSFDGSNYVAYPDPDMPNICIDEVYYFPKNFFFVQTSIDSITSVGVGDWEITGSTFDNVQVEIWVKDIGGVESLIKTVGGNDFSTSITSFTSATGVSVQARPKTLICSDFANSPWGILQGVGIGWMTIGTTNIVG